VVPSWSRDGQWIYFASNRGESLQIWKAPVNGGAARQVTTGGGFAAKESADAQYVYYAKGRTVSGLWRVPVNGGAEESVLPNLKPGYWGYWNLCNQSIFFVDKESPRSRAALFEFDLRSRKITRLFEIAKPPVVGDSSFAISQDCGTVLYSQRDQSGSDVMLVELEGK
jgi:hypothetical protein